MRTRMSAHGGLAFQGPTSFKSKTLVLQAGHVQITKGRRPLRFQPPTRLRIPAVETLVRGLQGTLYRPPRLRKMKEHQKSQRHQRRPSQLDTTVTSEAAVKSRRSRNPTQAPVAPESSGSLRVAGTSETRETPPALGVPAILEAPIVLGILDATFPAPFPTPHINNNNIRGRVIGGVIYLLEIAVVGAFIMGCLLLLSSRGHALQRARVCQIR
ncbi:hypothetical protein BJX64DRAFT_256000 [Aspergillus heterothallicus]